MYKARDAADPPHRQAHTERGKRLLFAQTRKPFLNKRTYTQCEVSTASHHSDGKYIEEKKNKKTKQWRI